MIDLRTIDELTRKLADALPPGVVQGKDELENRIRAVLSSAFERMNLVTREEFDRQLQRLEETRAKLAAIEEQLQND